MSLPDAINRAAGQPATIRVGVVVDASPLIIDMQGTLLQGDNLGRVGTAPALGDVVLLLGQSVRGAGSSGSSWVCLGKINPT